MASPNKNRHKAINRVELLHALHDLLGGEFNPLIAFSTSKGFQNCVYLYDKRHAEMRERGTLWMEAMTVKLGQPIVIFTDPLYNAKGMALTYKEWIEAGATMKAIELITNEQIYVLPVHDDDGNVVRYVSSDRSYSPCDIRILGEA